MDPSNAVGIGRGGVVIGYADSVDSSPRSYGGESWDEPFPSVLWPPSFASCAGSDVGWKHPPPHRKISLLFCWRLARHASLSSIATPPSLISLLTSLVPFSATVPSPSSTSSPTRLSKLILRLRRSSSWASWVLSSGFVSSVAGFMQYWSLTMRSGAERGGWQGTTRGGRKVAMNPLGNEALNFAQVMMMMMLRPYSARGSFIDWSNLKAGRGDYKSEVAVGEGSIMGKLLIVALSVVVFVLEFLRKIRCKHSLLKSWVLNTFFVPCCCQGCYHCWWWWWVRLIQGQSWKSLHGW